MISFMNSHVIDRSSFIFFTNASIDFLFNPFTPKFKKYILPTF